MPVLLENVNKIALKLRGGLVKEKPPFTMKRRLFLLKASRGNRKLMRTLRASYLECSFVGGHSHLALAFLAFHDPVIDKLENPLLIKTDNHVVPDQKRRYSLNISAA